MNQQLQQPRKGNDMTESNLREPNELNINFIESRLIPCTTKNGKEVIFLSNRRLYSNIMSNDCKIFTPEGTPTRDYEIHALKAVNPEHQKFIPPKDDDYR